MRLSPVEEIQQRLVDLYGMGPADTVRSAFDDHELRVVDEPGQALPRSVVRKNTVLITLNDQRRHVDFRQVTAKIGQPRSYAIQRALSRCKQRRLPCTRLA